MAKELAAVSRRKRAVRGSAAKPVLGKRVLRKTAKAPKKSTAKSPARSRAKAPRPIDLYYWPTPNGWKISIMLEECGLPYRLRPVNIAKGEQFAPAFLKISPNNRMPAIVDPDGPGGRAISIFESGAILQYLGRKTGKFYPADPRGRVAVDQWLFWQVGGLGPMAGQANHFLKYAPVVLEYAQKRYSDEVHRLLGVMERQLTGRKFLTGAYSIADIACWGWVVSAESYQSLDEFPHVAAWHARIGARPAVKRGHALGADLGKTPGSDLRSDESARKILFGQR
jgi:glutathione S-transferase